ncbi:MAG: glycosyltransferase family 2 protein [Firmicutes bacterium HGW-Firmicutes-15]|jgi:GT2 family glycosyltransferase|nr:MAG: glycosyltransferase family 2 protein [Spirochaetae bacterium HGW-Spirochaetae-2]PKM75903.1 MAG: glycosyltransferase family 2 protein [Firmicutes bacterium HGW-Firmicutes-15]
MLGIVILNYINWEDTEKCLLSIIDTIKSIPYRIFLVDNNSPTRCSTSLREIIDQNTITFIESSKNLGYSAGNNIGIKLALDYDCDKILITNNDVVFIESAIQNLCMALDKDSSVGIVGPKILNPDYSVDKQNFICIKTGMKQRYRVRTFLHYFFKKDFVEYYGLDRNLDDSFPVYSVSGCCFMIRRECAEVVLPFDENLFLYGEELILGIRMEEAGFKTTYFPESTIIHAHGKSTSSMRANSYMESVKSDIYYSKKYLGASLLSIFPLYINSMGGYLLRCIKYEDYRKNLRNFFKVTCRKLFYENG